MDENYWQLGTWRRIPVAMHWTVLLVFAWLYFIFSDLLATVIASAAFFVLLVVHEMGHVAVLRRRKIAVESITFYGIHGRTSHGFASQPDEILVAWGGVGAQALVLVAALAFAYVVDLPSIPLAGLIAGPILFTFIKLNIFLMIVALLPIGPFDGRSAWAAIPYVRSALRRRKRAAQEIARFPEKGLSPERRRELEESSAKAAEDLLGKFSKKPDSRKEDA